MRRLSAQAVSGRATDRIRRQGHGVSMTAVGGRDYLARSSMTAEGPLLWIEAIAFSALVFDA